MQIPTVSVVKSRSGGGWQLRITNSGLAALSEPDEPLPLFWGGKRKRSPKPPPTLELSAAVRECYDAGLIVGQGGAGCPTEIADGVYLCRQTQGWKAIAREIAAYLPGQIRPNVSGVSCQAGKNVYGTLLDEARYQSVIRAQAVVRRCYSEFGEPTPPLKWSVGACARQLLDTLGQPDTDGRRSAETTELLLEGIQHGYHEVRPGVYDYAEHHDVKAYYYSMLCRLPSIRVGVTPERVFFQAMAQEELERWGNILALVGQDKGLRNTITGVMLGVTQPKKSDYELQKQMGGDELLRPKRLGFYKRAPGSPGGVIWLSGPFLQAGPYRSAGLLLVRTGWEKTYQNSRQNDTIYARIDCIITPSMRTDVWAENGLYVEAKYKGKTEICHIGSWRVGPHATLPYRNGERGYNEIVTPNHPTVSYGQWL